LFTFFPPFRTLRVPVFIWSAFVPVFAAPTAPVSWESLPDLLRTHSPELISARRELEEIQARVEAAGWKPEPALTLEVKPALASGGQGSLQAGYERTLHRPERLRAERDAESAHIPLLQARLREREIVRIAEARAAAVQVLMADRRLEWVKQQQASARELAEVLANRVRAGEGSPLESAQAQFDAARLDVQRAQLEADRVQAEQTLRTLLGWPVDQPFSLTGSLADPTASDTTTKPAAPSAASEAARAEAALAEAEAGRARAAAKPENILGFLAELERAEDAPDGVGTEAFVGIAFTRPLAVPGKAEAATRESRLRARRLQDDATILDAAALREAEAARAVMNAQARIFSSTDAEPARLAAAQQELAESLLRAGQGDLTAVLRARAQRLSLEESRLKALEDFHLARVRLDAALGR
jgi:cobalt-zinc-cadmium efflux system outer membrane protein